MRHPNLQNSAQRWAHSKLSINSGDDDDFTIAPFSQGGEEARG